MRLAMGAAVVLGLTCLGFTARPPVAANQAAEETTQAVVLQLTLGDQTPARVVIRTGETARVTVAGKTSFGLTPLVKDGVLALDVAELTKDSVTGAESPRLLKRLQMPAGKTERFEHPVLKFDVEWVESRAVPRLQSGTAAAPSGATMEAGSTDPLAVLRSPCRSCCVNCGDLTICSCGVEMSCGSCCCPVCCDAKPRPACVV
jgi:hypothetical protein